MTTPQLTGQPAPELVGPTDLRRALRSLYLVRAVFALVWAAVLVATSAAATSPSILLTTLLVIYPLADAAAVLRQVRAHTGTGRSTTAERANIVVSLVVALALGITSSIAIPAALAVWGIWAITAGIPQLAAAVRHRRAGGQVAQMLSGGISVLAGTGFLAQGLRGEGALAGVAGYATLGAVFFLVSVIRLDIVLRRRAGR